MALISFDVRLPDIRMMITSLSTYHYFVILICRRMKIYMWENQSLFYYECISFDKTAIKYRVLFSKFSLVRSLSLSLHINTHFSWIFCWTSKMVFDKTMSFIHNYSFTWPQKCMRVIGLTKLFSGHHSKMKEVHKTRVT